MILAQSSSLGVGLAGFQSSKVHLAQVRSILSAN